MRVRRPERGAECGGAGGAAVVHRARGGAGQGGRPRAAAAGAGRRGGGAFPVRVRIWVRVGGKVTHHWLINTANTIQGIVDAGKDAHGC